MRLIDADAIVTIQTFNDETEEYAEEKMTIEQDLDRWSDEGCPPIIDAVQVVRCKDCKYWQRSKIKGNRNHDYHICLNSRHGYCIISFENDYCSRGRRAK